MITPLHIKFVRFMISMQKRINDKKFEAEMTLIKRKNFLSFSVCNEVMREFVRGVMVNLELLTSYQAK